MAEYAKINYRVSFLGNACPYDEVLADMHKRHQALALNPDAQGELLLLEHQPVITLTRQHLERSIKTSMQAIALDKIHVAIADRGGDATFHGPGQLVGYPLINLRHQCLQDGNVDLERYIRLLELCLLRAVHELGFTKARTVPHFTGIWYRFDDDAILLKKLIAIGVGIKDFVTKHGFALNVDIDHERFSKHIVPCGLKDRGVTTLKEIAEQNGLAMPSRNNIMDAIVHSLQPLFVKQRTLEMPQHFVMVNNNSI